MKFRLRSLAQSIRTRMKRFASEASGTVAVTFAAVTLPTMFLIGAAIDYSRVGPGSTQIQTALDSALLAGVIAPPGSQIATAQAAFATQTALATGNFTASFTLNDDNSLSGTASGSVPTAFMGITRLRSLSVAASGKATPPQTPSIVVFQLTAAYGYYWKSVELYIHKPGDSADTLMASYVYQPVDMTGGGGNGTGTTTATFNVNGVMTSNAVTTPVNIGSAYDNIYLKMTVYSDGCGAGMAPNPNYPQTGYQKNFQCVTSGTKVNGSKVTKSASPVYYSTNNATTAHNLFIGTPSVALPNNKVPNIFTLIPCNKTIQHAWEDTPYYDANSWSHQDIFFNVSASSCGRNSNYPTSGQAARLVQ